MTFARSRLATSHRRLVTSALAGLALAAFASAALAQSPDTTDWPCVQRLVPSVAAAQLWPGPELPAPVADWDADPGTAAIADAVMNRDLPTDEAVRRLDEHLAELPAERREAELAAIFTGLVEKANAERGRMIDGIERFARRQRALAGQINAETRKLRDVEAQATEAAQREALDLREARQWDMRVYDERERTMTLLCQKPVEVDQRAFGMARVIAERMKGG